METKKRDTTFASKWSYDIEQYGYTQVPNLLLVCQGHLEITDAELVTYIQLMKFWFSNGGNVFPSITTLTKFSNNNYSTVQRRLRILEEKGFIVRVHRYGTSNMFDLTPGIQKLDKHQEICTSRPHLRLDGSVKVTRGPTSLLSDKEDEALIGTTSNDTLTNVDYSDITAFYPEFFRKPF